MPVSPIQSATLVNLRKLLGPIAFRTQVGTADILAGSIVANSIAANAVTAAQIAAGTITAAEIAASTITTGVIAANAITANGSIVDNTSTLIGTSDTQIGMVSLSVNASSDLILFLGFVAMTVSGYAATGSTTITSKLWRGTVASGTALDTEAAFLNSSNATTLAGAGGTAFSFFDTGISGVQSYSLSLAAQTGPTITKTRCVIVATDFKR